MGYRWWSSCQSHRGRRRKINEDAYLAMPEIGVWAVADGMGGHARGDRASQYVIDALRTLTSSANLEDLVVNARAALQVANQRVREDAKTLPDNEIMGSTVVVFIACNGQFTCLWAGDSRAYLLRDGRLTQLSHDHSKVQELVDGGTITIREARVHPAANRITRAVGARKTLVVDDVRGDIRDGDAVLLCSDGLTLEVVDDEIAIVLEEFDSESATRELMDLCLERGARDNVTIGVVQFEETTGVDWEAADTTAVNYEFRKEGRLRMAMRG